MPEYDQLYIGGRWCAPRGRDRIAVHSPTTGEFVGSVARAGTADVDDAVAAARRAFDEGEWPRLTVAERVEALTRMRNHLAWRADELNELSTRENGVSIAVRPCKAALDLFDFTLEAAGIYTFTEERSGIQGRAGEVVREPSGVVGAIVASNGPLLQAVGKIAPALVAGCTVVLKSPVETPLILMALAEAADAAGLPEGVFSVLSGDVVEGEHLVTHPGVDKISFTGSAGAGRLIAEAAGRQLKRTTLELGGKSAAVVLPDADLDHAARTVAMGCMAYSGQRCAALSRALVPAGLIDDFVERVAAAVSAFTVGDPLDESTFIGPLVSRRGLERVERYVDAALAEGARAVVGGARMADRPDGWYFQPTVLVGVTNDMQIAREEVFGPVLCVIPYDTVDEAVAMANDNDYGLTSSVFSGNREAAAQVARRIRAGSIGLNAIAGEIGLPFGGFKASGYGREYSIEAFDSFTEVKAIA
jgi:betaine-aldehyde dehydrogenase